MRSELPGAGRIRLLALLMLASIVAACTWRIEVEGWTVDCRILDSEVCRGVAGVALNNLAGGRPRVPTGVITVSERSCPEVPDWADPRPCWRVVIPLPGRAPGCLVVAARLQLGGYGQVGGEWFAGLPRPDANDRPDC